MDFVTLEAKSHKGKNRITEARKRLPKWDGNTWRVVQEKKRVSFSSDPGPWAHVTPNTEDNTDWCSRWVNLREDDNFTVTANALGEGRERGILREASSGEAATSTDGLEGAATARKP